MAKKNNFFKAMALTLGIVGLGFGAFKITQYFTERTRKNRVEISFQKQ